MQNMPVWAGGGRRNLDNVQPACYIPIIIMCISARGYACGETEDTMAEEKKKIMIHTASGDHVVDISHSSTSTNSTHSTR